MSEKDNKIDLPTAVNWTSNWRDEKSEYSGHRLCNGFLVPAEDMEGALKEMELQVGAKYIRVYLGVDQSTNPPMEKLIVVGTQPEVQRDGSIIYRDMVPGQQDVQLAKGSIWDFSEPCPPASDPNSPLAG